MTRHRVRSAVFTSVLLLGQTACLFHTRYVEPRTSTAKLESATKQQLVDYINRESSKIKTLNATVDIATSVGGEKKGKVTQYEEIRGYILVRKPDNLRMIGLFPIVRNKAFDMVSDGENFRLSIPAKNKFYVGHNNVVTPSGNSLENIRPQVIYDALLLPELNGSTDVAVLEDSEEVVYDTKTKRNLEQPDYVLDVIHHGDDGWYLARKVIFNRVTLVPDQQIIYDSAGAVATQARYQAYRDYQGVSFPDVIEVNRPHEEYSIRLTMQKLLLNEPLRDDQFALQQPPGSQLVNLDQPQANQTAAGDSPQTASPKK